ncbi:MAG: exosortase P [Sciscionella sp.]
MTVAASTSAPSTPRPTKFLVLALLAVAACLVIFLRAYRTVEIVVAGTITGLLASSTGTYIDAANQTFYFGLGGPSPLGLRMAPECTSALLILPLVLVAAVMIFLRPRIAKRVIISLAIAAVVLFVVNQLRLLLLVGLVDWFGTSTGYYWGHTLLGSIVSVFGGAIALVLFVWLSTRGTRTPKPPSDQEAPAP